MTEGQKALGGKIAISELIAEEHAQNRSDWKRIQDHSLFAGTEVEAWQITENERKPGAPDEELEHHHQEKSKTNIAHGSAMPIKKDFRANFRTGVTLKTDHANSECKA